MGKARGGETSDLKTGGPGSRLPLWPRAPTGGPAPSPQPRPHPGPGVKPEPGLSDPGLVTWTCTPAGATGPNPGGNGVSRQEPESSCRGPRRTPALPPSHRVPPTAPPRAAPPERAPPVLGQGLPSAGLRAHAGSLFPSPGTPKLPGNRLPGAGSRPAPLQLAAPSPEQGQAPLGAHAEALGVRGWAPAPAASEERGSRSADTPTRAGGGRRQGAQRGAGPALAGQPRARPVVRPGRRRLWGGQQPPLTPQG